MRSVIDTNRPQSRIKKRMICIALLLLFGAVHTAHANDMLPKEVLPVNGLDLQTHEKFEQSDIIPQPNSMQPIAPIEVATAPEPTPIQIIPEEIDPVATNIPTVPYKRISSGFGIRKHPLSGRVKQHRGIDIPFPMGTPILAPANGIVIFAGWQNGYGNVIKIDHTNGYETVIAHNSVNLVHKGDYVTITTTIAKVGASGAATGPHIHFEIRFNGNLLDPVSFLRKVD